MLGLPMEIIGPVLGIGSLILFVTAGIVTVRLVNARIAQRQLKARGESFGEHHQLLEEVQDRLGELDEMKQRIGELEERVDFTERLLARPREEREG